MNARWRKLADGTWGVRVEGRPDAAKLAGNTIEVSRRDGRTAPVKLLALIETLDDGSAIYTAESQGWGGGGRRRRNGSTSAAAVPTVPRTVTVDRTGMASLLDNGTLTIDGVTFVFDAVAGSLTLTFA